MTSTPATSLDDLDQECNQGDVAIIGIACRLAGGIDSVDKFWKSILSKQDCSGEIPKMRWEPYYRRDIRNADILRNTTSRGYFLDRLEDFDAAFFGVSPLEAEQMDPQQRVALEVTWEALEHAGVSATSLAGSDTAVFMGVNSDDYSRLVLEDLPGVEAWMGIGSAFCGIPNRISYLLGLRGPSSAIDAACASSLVAVHHGRQALLAGETKLAIVGGVNALVGPGLTRVLDKAGAITPEGNCRSFDATASGYGRGEGASILILKRLPEAIMNGDRILAVLKGSAVGQDGKTNGIMSPNQAAQEEVARKALAAARVDPLSVGFVEAHATSTPVGDPCEVAAIAAVYGNGAGRPRKEPCKIGSVKPNFGHLEAGAGATSLIKAILAINRATFPPQANFETPNPRMDWDNNCLEVIRHSSPWLQDRRRAGVCSYGYGGTVAHAVIEQPPVVNPIGQAIQRDGPYLCLLSSPHPSRTKDSSKILASWIPTSSVSISTIANTLGLRRAHHLYRSALVADSKEDLTRLLKISGCGEGDPWIAQEKVSASSNMGAVWVFSGHGSHWANMGKELLDFEPTFYAAISSLESVVQNILGFSLIEALKSGDFETTERQQALTYAIQIGLAAVLKSRGVEPAAIIGHSVGEIAASVVAGCLTAEEGAYIVAQRALLYRRVVGKGAMILVDLSYEDALTRIKETNSDIAAAIHSSPSSSVLSGGVEAVSELARQLETENVKVRRVNTDVALHSPLLDELADPLREILKSKIRPTAPTTPLYSTSLSDSRGLNKRDENYWVDNMLNPVWLTSAIRAGLEDGFRIFVEISAHPIISHSVNETMIESDVEGATIIPTLLRNKSTRKALLMTLGRLHCLGVKIGIRDIFSGGWSRDVPATRWMHKPFWRQVGIESSQKIVTHDINTHTLLGARNYVFGSDITLWTSFLDETIKPFPGSHPLQGTEIVPAAVLLNTFLHTRGLNSLKDVILRVPVAINAGRDLQVVVDQRKVKLSSRLRKSDGGALGDDDTSWLTHTTALLEEAECNETITDLSQLKRKLKVQMPPSFAIDYLKSVGVPAMGFPWKVLEHYGDGEEMLSKVDTCPGCNNGMFPWDQTSWAPALDAATSIGSSIFYKEPILRMPAKVDQVTVWKQPIPRVVYIHTTMASETWSVNISARNEAGQEIAAFKCMRFSAVEGTPGSSGSVESLVHQIAWPPARLDEEPFQLRNIIFISEDTNRLERYRGELRRRGIMSTVIRKISDVQVDQLVEGSIVVLLPEWVRSEEGVFEVSSRLCLTLLDAAKYLVSSQSVSKLWCVTEGLFEAKEESVLAQGPLIGLSRIIASEHPEIWGGFVDVDDDSFPLQAVKYVKATDIISVRDSVARVARLRPIPRTTMMPQNEKIFNPKPEGTYLITGGTGALGLETAAWMVEKGARRLILVSRKGLPPRRVWEQHRSSVSAIPIIEALEKLGATITVLPIDISQYDGAEKLERAMYLLGLPAVTGVVHAAGVLDDQLVTETTKESFDKVLAPKITGAMTLHRLFPPGSLDFMVLFSSCGQLLGFPGQASYASGNSFLDTFADYRRTKGDNIISFLWTSWSGLGMASSTEYINAELEAKGITSISRDEGFRAWEYAIKQSPHQAVVLRALPVEDGVPPLPILDEIAPRKGVEVPSSSRSKDENQREVPSSGAELKAYLKQAISECVATTLRLSTSADVDPSIALTEMGMDSVMTVTLRKHLQSCLKVKIPPTLIWGHPTVDHLVSWFRIKFNQLMCTMAVQRVENTRS
ncbi:hypothetical protein ABW19_dt0204370 [Dactylella cylindrospora]|nr:hypothetical protein ABW19_dt0204370 [Dactylella cylindrospora]